MLVQQDRRGCGGRASGVVLAQEWADRPIRNLCLRTAACTASAMAISLPRLFADTRSVDHFAHALIALTTR